ncbi:LexA family protein [Filifactor villosus]|uniref:LexA family protein n=1 Tax=Filifactor villosus TaxID=29374 RepID=A0ABV9QKL4_9FIRM
MKDKVLLRLLDAIKEKNLNEKDPLISCGINTNLFVDWKKKAREGKVMYPSYDKIAKLSTFLGLSLNYVIFGEDREQEKSYFPPQFSEKNRAELELYIEFLNYREKQNYDETKEEYTLTPKKEEVRTKQIPILGETAAGSPKLMDAPYYSEDELIEVPESSKANYALRVRGDSMEPEIKDNQIIFIKEQPYAENGQIVVVATDLDTITCKRFYKFHNKIELRSINPFYNPIIIKAENSENFRIIGMVIDA